MEAIEGLLQEWKEKAEWRGSKWQWFGGFQTCEEALDIFWSNGIPVQSAWWCRVCIYYVTFVIRGTTRIFSSEIRRFTNIDDEHEEGKLNEYSEEEGNKHVKNWRLAEIFERGNFYNSGTT